MGDVVRDGVLGGKESKVEIRMLHWMCGKTIVIK